MTESETHPDAAVKVGDHLSGEQPIADERQRMCERKTRYADKKAAMTYLNTFKKSRGRHGRPQWMRAYACPHCNGWHLTKGKAR